VDLRATWSVLQTEAAKTGTGITVVDSGVELLAGKVLVGVDSGTRRVLLIPLRPGEAFAEDRTGRSVHLVRISHEGTDYLGAVSLQPDLDEVFAQFASELLFGIAEAESPARATVAALERWRRLFSEADRSGLLSHAELIGLFGELLVLERLLLADPERRLSVWTGPSGNQHDFRSGVRSIEVKATLAREGRIVPISSVDQLSAAPGGQLFLAHFRLELLSTGDNIQSVIERIRDLCIEPERLDDLLRLVGYREMDADSYRDLRYRVVDYRFYDVEGPSFPRIVPESFIEGVIPAGTLRLRYSIDLTNAPPTPLNQEQEGELLKAMVG
jgi:hypothetical protein